MFKITGQVSPKAGDGLAHKNYRVMIPAIAVYCPAVAGREKFGSINVINLVPPLSKQLADCWTPEVTWRPAVNLPSPRKEFFGVIQIQFECPLGAPLHDASILIIEGHPWAYNDNEGVEIVAATLIPNVTRGESCAIYLDHAPAQPRPKAFGSHFEGLHPPFIVNDASIPKVD